MRFNVFVALFSIFLQLHLTGCAVVDRVNSSKQYKFDISSEKGLDPLLNGEFRVNDSKGVCYIVFYGVITADSARAFRLASNDIDKRSCNQRIVIMSSGGGNVKSAIEMGRIIRAKGYTTASTIGGGKCYSSCGIAFIGGTKRLMNDSLSEAKVGFHQLSVQQPDGKKRCLPHSHEASLAVESYAKDMLEPAAADLFFKLVTSTNCNEINALSPKELIDSGIATGLGLSFSSLF